MTSACSRSSVAKDEHKEIMDLLEKINSNVGDIRKLQDEHKDIMIFLRNMLEYVKEIQGNQIKSRDY